MPEFHELSDIFPLMSESELSDLADDIRANGLHESIVLYAGEILDGRNRYIACELAGVEPKFTEYAGDDPLAFVVSLNLKRRHLNESQRAMIAARLANMRQGARTDLQPSANLPKVVSQSKAADLLSIGERSIRHAKHVLTSGLPELAQAVERGEIAVSRAAEIVNGKVPHVLHNSGNNEWYTPQEYIDAARMVMGDIDLDPASSDEANALIGASRYYTIETDGLTKRWHGKLWLNPPYASELIGKFSDKIVSEYSRGNVQQAIVLVNNATETDWFQTMARATRTICFPQSRIKFWGPNGKTGAPLQGQALFYFGRNAKKFGKIFSRFGLVLWREA